MHRLLLIITVTFSAACAPQLPTEPEVAEDKAADDKVEFGICYDARGCTSGSESWISITQSQCSAANEKSWKGRTSACINL